MDNAAQEDNTEAQESLLNLSVSEEAEASQEAPIPLHDDSDAPVGQEADSDEPALERQTIIPKNSGTMTALMLRN